MSLKQYRKNSGLTQESLAKRAGVSRAFINQLESGRSKSPSVQVALKIASALGTTVEDLWGTKQISTCPERSPAEVLNWGIGELNKLKKMMADEPMFN